MVVLENKFFPHGNLDPSEQELNWAARVGAVPQGADAWAVRSGLPEASSLGLRAPLIVLRGPLPFRNLESPDNSRQGHFFQVAQTFQAFQFF